MATVKNIEVMSMLEKFNADTIGIITTATIVIIKTFFSSCRRLKELDSTPQ
jgi:hypothetical protein